MGRPAVTYTDWDWPDGHTSTTCRLPIKLRTPLPAYPFGYFPSCGFGFGSSLGGGYIGFQEHANPGGGKIAIYSIFTAVATDAAAGAIVVTGEEGDTFQSLRIAYPWVVNEQYEFVITRRADPTWWDAWVRHTGDADFLIGGIQMSGSRTLDNNGSNFLEIYQGWDDGSHPCNYFPYVGAEFGVQIHGVDPAPSHTTTIQDNPDVASCRSWSKITEV